MYKYFTLIFHAECYLKNISNDRIENIVEIFLSLFSMSEQIFW